MNSGQLPSSATNKNKNIIKSIKSTFGSLISSGSGKNKKGGHGDSEARI